MSCHDGEHTVHQQVGGGGGGGRGHLRGEAGSLPGPLGDAPLDDLGLGHQHIHQVTAIHEVKKEVEVVLVLEAGILTNAEGVCCVACNGLLTEHVLRALHHRRLAHALQSIRPVC